MVVPVPPLIAVTLGVLGAAFVVRHVLKEWRRDGDVEKTDDPAVAKSKSDVVPTLRRGPDGIFRPYS